ncbi:MAG: MarR family transcriptional regulator [Gemmatimonadetes bacterium]|nr:MarR family transcriptional regulator [Gemmatimonadota bacterium]MBI3568226.1 MarR family transcriptional regulator [Gemmatimonadota bacterium]
MKATHLAFLAIQRAAAALADQSADLLKAEGLSIAQYNVLRILRGAGQHPLSCGEIAGRLIARGPDMTRLLDRMQRDGLVARERRRDDRRVVGTHLTPHGRSVLERLDAPMAALHDRQLEHLGHRRLRQLITLVDVAVPPRP